MYIRASIVRRSSVIVLLGLFFNSFIALKALSAVQVTGRVAKMLRRVLTFGNLDGMISRALRGVDGLSFAVMSGLEQL
jgi:hypothetical protein